ncbi:MlaD family protein [Rhodococcus erythropolis]|uniref:MCE family protein n=1 Tax=Rhodococcus erythropolis TaxID=1833 RepID=UPI001E5EAB4C|nr:MULTISPECIES: MlaD family protein [Rhodococcus erythropolis group]MCD2107127.1 MCE family protein [Rhodococcus qingshengii]MCZ4526556.1 MlaD family protein [Rhodococcus erythropolis]
MHKSRLVKTQLSIFAVLTVSSLLYAGFNYSGLQRTTGIGMYSVTAHFSDGSGIYDNAIVTYRGADIGTVESIDLTDDGVAITLQLKSDQPVPADTSAAIKSVSAIGEQYVDLIPYSSDGPYLASGSTIEMSRTSVPTSAGTLLDNVHSLLAAVPSGALQETLDESSLALNDAGSQLGSLIESSNELVRLANADLGQTITLIDDGETLLATGNTVADDLKSSTRDLASFTQQLARSDDYLRDVLDTGAGFADTTGSLLTGLTPTMPTLLADLQSVGQVLRVNVPGLQQILVIYPAVSASLNFSVQNQDFQLTDDTMVAQAPLDVKLLDTFGPLTCTEGYQGTQRRDPLDLTPEPTNHEGSCSLPQNDPRGVRGSRNIACVSNPAIHTKFVADCPGGAPSTWQGMLSSPVGSFDRYVSPKSIHTNNAAPAASEAPLTTAAVPIPYNPTTGAFIAPGGQSYTVASLATTSPKKETSRWEELLTGPLEA